MVLSDLDVAGLVYLVTSRRIHVALVRHGSCEWIELADVDKVLDPIAALRDELADTWAVTRRRLPGLARFAQGWGRSLIPAGILREPPDILVLVPHAFLHSIPLHLIQADNGQSLACCSGTSYASSPTLLLRTAACNPARGSATWRPPQAAGGGTDVLGPGPDEFHAIASEVLENFGANPTVPFGRTAVRTAMRRRAATLCIVTHGFVDSDDHADSGILLDLDDRVERRSTRVADDYHVLVDVPTNDLPAGLHTTRPAQVLTLHEIGMDDPAQAELTMLLACSAGASEVLQGDEPGSLAEALLRVGSVSVIAPMWVCDYAFARAWVQAFLSAWGERGMAKAMAAREAFLALDDGTDVAQLGPIHLRGDWL
jgi:CHAT domain-containing protein